MFCRKDVGLLREGVTDSMIIQALHKCWPNISQADSKLPRRSSAIIITNILKQGLMRKTQQAVMGAILKENINNISDWPENALFVVDGDICCII